MDYVREIKANCCWILYPPALLALNLIQHSSASPLPYKYVGVQKCIFPAHPSSGVRSPMTPRRRARTEHCLLEHHDRARRANVGILAAVTIFCTRLMSIDRSCELRILTKRPKHAAADAGGQEEAQSNHAECPPHNHLSREAHLEGSLAIVPAPRGAPHC